MSLEKSTSEKTTSFQFNNYLKLGVVSVASIGAYALARATYMFSGWLPFSLDKALSRDVSHEAQSNVVEWGQDKAAMTAQLSLTDVTSGVGLSVFEEVSLELPQTIITEDQKTGTTHQRNLLSQTTVLKPIPDQIINANELYDFSIDVNEIFGPGMQALAITGIPAWMNANYYPHVQNFQLPEAVNAITIVGTKAYVVDGRSGLYILDITNPSAPVLLGHYGTPGTAYNVVVSGNIAYVADGISLQILNVSNPGKPTYLSIYLKLGAVLDIAVNDNDNLAYVIDGSFLQFLNISDPLMPILIGSGFIVGLPNRLIINDDTPYLATSMGIYTYDYVPPVLLTPMLLGQYLIPTGADSVAVVGATAYVVDYSTGLYIINVTNPTAPILLAQYATPGWAVSVTVVGTTAYLAEQSYTGFSGLQIINVANSTAPILLGQYVTSGGGEHVTVVGTTAYVAESSRGPSSNYKFNGLQIINVTDPAAPTLLGQYTTTGGATSVTVVGTTAYVGTYSSNLQIINVINPAAPTLLGQYTTLGYNTISYGITSVTVVGMTAYLPEFQAIFIHYSLKATFYRSF